MTRSAWYSRLNAGAIARGRHLRNVIGYDSKPSMFGLLLGFADCCCGGGLLGKRGAWSKEEEMTGMSRRLCRICASRALFDATGSLTGWCQTTATTMGSLGMD